MAEGQEIGRALGGHDARHPGHREGISLAHRPLGEQLDGLDRHAYLALGHRTPVRVLLVAHVHHVGFAPGIEVRQLAHRLSSQRSGRSKRPPPVCQRRLSPTTEAGA
jgi:hypothetical protein